MGRIRPNYMGIMTSYVCSAACRHCMYASSPKMPGAFMARDMANGICRQLRDAGVRSMHIGGGEPFLNFDSLVQTIEAMNDCGIGVDYIETNASWCTSRERVNERLAALRRLGATCVMASVDPFHIEFVPLERPLMLVDALRAAGFEYFVWQEKFLRRLLAFDQTKPVPHDELAAVLGADYVEQSAREYGLGANGRALFIAQRMFKRQPLDALLQSSPCRLLDGNHCHVDLYGNMVPSGCPGIAIELGDFLMGNVPKEKYPVAARAMREGLAGLYAYAAAEGFEADAAGYVSPCDLCYAIRAHLRVARPSRDIGPDCYYDQMASAH